MLAVKPGSQSESNNLIIIPSNPPEESIQLSIPLHTLKDICGEQDHHTAGKTHITVTSFPPTGYYTANDSRRWILNRVITPVCDLDVFKSWVLTQQGSQLLGKVIQDNGQSGEQVTEGLWSRWWMWKWSELYGTWTNNALFWCDARKWRLTLLLFGGRGVCVCTWCRGHAVKGADQQGQDQQVQSQIPRKDQRVFSPTSKPTRTKPTIHIETQRSQVKSKFSLHIPSPVPSQGK